jgi:hypothetical protein
MSKTDLLSYLSRTSEARYPPLDMIPKYKDRKKMSIFDNVVSGKIDKPAKLLVWGPPAVGKTTFASEAPSPIFIEAEDRSGHLDVNRIPVGTWADVMEAINALNKEEHPYKTAVFDTVDAMEILLFDHISKEAGVDSHEEIGGGFAKFRGPMVAQWKRFVRGIDALTHKGIQCILLAHAKTKPYQDPAGPVYDRFVLKMDQAGGDFLIENVDLVGYAKFQVFVKKDDKNAKSKATTTGKRLLQFKFSPVYPTKCGVPCADEVALDWDEFQKGLG